MKNILLKLARWIFTRYGIECFFVTPAIRLIIKAASSFTDQFDPYSKEGEWKRHQVYGRLVKQFPKSDRRDISLAIELALPPKGEK